MKNKWLLKPGLTLIVIVFLILYPLLFTNATGVVIAIITFLLATAALGWNIFGGYTGYMALGFGTYYGLGAYTLMLLCEHFHIPGGYLPFALLPVAGLVAALFAIPLGWLSLRTRREAFVVITLASLFIFQLLAANLKGITLGNQTYFFPIPPWTGDFLNYPFYYVSLAILLLTFFVAWWIRRSKYGLGLLAIREDEERTQGLGIKTGVYKLSAFVTSAFFGGMVGALTIYFSGSIDPPSAFNPAFNVTVILMAFLGGVGTLTGPLVGAILFQLVTSYITPPISQLLSAIVGHDLEQGYVNIVIVGILLLLVLLFLPEGIVPASVKFWRKWHASQQLKKDSLNTDKDTTTNGLPILAESGKGGE